MDVKRIGLFLKELRKEKQITQEELAEKLGVSNRTVSRWETGSNMPDFDVLIELSDFYDVEIKEILEGEKKEKECSNSKEELLLIADYNNQQKKKLTVMIKILFLIGLISMVVYLFIHNINELELVSQFLLGITFSVLLIGLLFTTKYMIKIRELKLRLLNRKRGGSKND